MKIIYPNKQHCLLPLNVALLTMVLSGCGGSSSPEVAAQISAGDALCAPNLMPTTIGNIQSADIIEASGLVFGRLNKDVMWTHNDSGNALKIFALTEHGALRATVDLGLGIPAGSDAEDIAVGGGPIPNANYIYLGDIGDNFKQRTSLTIYRIEEPNLAGMQDGATLTAQPDVIEVVYPDGPHDAETMIVDPVRGDLFIVEKVLFPTTPMNVYRSAGFTAARNGDVMTLENVGQIPFFTLPVRQEATVPFAPRATTGGAISQDGSIIMIRTYGYAWLWTRSDHQDVAQALAATPCQANIAQEPQGEAIAITPDGRGFITTSEGVHPELHKVTAN